MVIHPSERPPWPEATPAPSTSYKRPRLTGGGNDSIKRRRTEVSRQVADQSQIGMLTSHMQCGSVSWTRFHCIIPMDLDRHTDDSIFFAAAAQTQCEVFSGNQVISCFPKSDTIVNQHEYAPFVCASCLRSQPLASPISHHR